MSPTVRILEQRRLPKVLIVGEHDKGLGEPFSPTTVSGRRLRQILSAIRVEYSLVNMMSPSSRLPTTRDLSRLRAAAEAHDLVVLLGRRVQGAMSAHFPDALALPHPASRRPSDLITLRTGLAALGRVAEVESDRLVYC